MMIRASNVPMRHPKSVWHTFSIFIIDSLLLLACWNIRGYAETAKDPKSTEIWEPVPRVIIPAANHTSAPSDAIILFDGTHLDKWQSVRGTKAEWHLADGAMIIAQGKGDLRTLESFGDCQLHIEWRTPTVLSGNGQNRGNSGIKLQGRYEVQVLDSHQNPTYSNGQAGSIYKQHIPLVNACLPAGQWQSYDIVYRAPVFTDNGKLAKPAFITVLHNGILIQDHVELKGATTYKGQPTYKKHAAREPLVLQDHGCAVSYRNIWIRDI